MSDPNDRPADGHEPSLPPRLNGLPLANLSPDPLALRIYSLTCALPPDEREWVTAALRQAAAGRGLLDDLTLDLARTPEAQAARRAAAQRAREVGRRVREENQETHDRRAAGREARRQKALELGDLYAAEHGAAPSKSQWDEMLRTLPANRQPPWPLSAGTVNRLWGKWSAFEVALGQRFALTGRGVLLRSAPDRYSDEVLEEGIELAIRNRELFDPNLGDCVDEMRAQNAALRERGEPERFPNSQNPFFRQAGQGAFHATRARVQERLAQEGLLPPMPSRKRGPAMDLRAAWEEWESRLQPRLRTVEEALEMHRLRPDRFPDPATLDLGPLTQWKGVTPDELMLELLRDAQARHALAIGRPVDSFTLPGNAYRRIRYALVARAREHDISLKVFDVPKFKERFGGLEAALERAGLPHQGMHTTQLTDEQVLDTVQGAVLAGRAGDRRSMEAWRADELAERPDVRLATWPTLRDRLHVRDMNGAVAALCAARPPVAAELACRADARAAEAGAASGTGAAGEQAGS